MSSHKNQHWVPQFYFRLFSHDEKRINALIIPDGKTVLGASIKGQCARHKFYGESDAEKSLCAMEAEDSAIIRRAIAFTEKRDSRFSEREEHLLKRAALLQRARTLSEVSRVAESIKEMKKIVYGPTSVESRSDTCATVLNRESETSTGMRLGQPNPASIESLQKYVSLLPHIEDLKVCFLRNATEFPFIFSDAPVVLTNPYLQYIKLQGTLGLACPGLIIAWPLSSSAYVIMLDMKVYFGRYASRKQADVVFPSDVLQLNALQAHSASKALYYEKTEHAKYVLDLWDGQKTRILKQKTWVQGLVPADQPDPTYKKMLIGVKELPLGHVLDLSGLRSRSRPREPYYFRRRDQAAYERAERIIAKNNKNSRRK